MNPLPNTTQKPRGFISSISASQYVLLFFLQIWMHKIVATSETEPG